MFFRYKSKKPSRYKTRKLFIGLTTKPATGYKAAAKQHNNLKNLFWAKKSRFYT